MVEPEIAFAELKLKLENDARPSFDLTPAQIQIQAVLLGVNLMLLKLQLLLVLLRESTRSCTSGIVKENESAFDLLYCITFKLMDQQWLNMRASYMDFNTVMKSTRRQLEKELLEDITRLEDLPSYGLLT
nr:hypothetical protein CFP56_15242 [Quercus suber]